MRAGPEDGGDRSYLVNSTTRGLVFGQDGALTMHIQHDEPDTDEGRADWLPAPSGLFYLVLRLYLPEEAALDGSWDPPPVEPVDQYSDRLGRSPGR